MSQIVARRLRGARLGSFDPETLLTTQVLPGVSVRSDLLEQTRQPYSNVTVDARVDEVLASAQPDFDDMGYDNAPSVEAAAPAAAEEGGIAKWGPPVALAAVVLGAFWWLR